MSTQNHYRIKCLPLNLFQWLQVVRLEKDEEEKEVILETTVHRDFILLLLWKWQIY